MPKLYWKVQPKATGPYASFQPRAWPRATLDRKGDIIVFQILCDDDYGKHRVDGNHAPLKLSVALPRGDGTKAWNWRKMKGEWKTLDEAKAAAQKFFDEHHDKLVRAD